MRSGGDALNRKKFIKEALPALTLLGLIEIFTGVSLSKSDFSGIAGLLVVIPALISIRGNVAGSFASRLSSMAHLGVFDPEHPFRTAWEGFFAVIIMSTSFSAFVIIISYICLSFVGVYMDFIAVLVVVLLTSASASLLLAVVSMIAVARAFRGGLDPDNVVTPLVATIGDFVTVFFLGFFIWAWEVFI